MKNNSKTDRPKRPYAAPRMRVIALAAEEILGVGCKVEGGGAAPMGVTCTVNNCSAAAS